MNYSNYLICGSILGSLMLISCDYIEIPAPDLSDTLRIEGDAFIQNSGMVMNERFIEDTEPAYLAGSGKLNGIDIDGHQFLMDFTINMTHHVWIDAQNNFHLGEGKFGISGNNGVDYLQGEYTGGGRNEGTETTIGLKLRITGGTGKFQQAKGALSAVLTSLYENKDGIRIKYGGMVLVPENEPDVKNE